MSTRTSRTVIINKNSTLHTIATSGNSIASSKINSSMKKNDSGNSESEVINATKNGSIVKQSSNSCTFSNVRSASTCVTVHENSTKQPKDYASKKFAGEGGSNIKNYPIKLDYKEPMSASSLDYKSRNSGLGIPLRFATQQSTIATSVFYRENHTPSSTYMQSNIAGSQKSDSNVAFAVARKALEQQHNSMSKVAPINFPPLRAPQSIVNVRHPLLTDARAKYANEKVVGGSTGGGDSGGGGGGKLNMMNSLQGGGMKELVDHTGHSQATFHGYGTSPIAAGIPNVRNLSNLSNAVTASISPYPDSFPQPTVASVLFSDTAAQFPQSPPFNTQIGQLNHQYQTYDPGSFAATPVNVNPVIPQFSADSSIPYPQYENPPQFVQPNHYPTADMTNNQYQYQAAAAGVSQIQDSSMFIQSPIAVADQYVAPNYARAVRTELIPRAMRRPPRFNK